MENSKTYQYRKVMKPILERKRRARINKCLDDLKDLMVECLTQEGEHIVRLEKADILELTVDYLKKIKHTGQPNPADSSESFRSGYVHAANEVSKVLASTRGVDVSLGTTLMTHLGYRLNQLQTPDLHPVGSQNQVKPLRAMSPLKIELDHTQPMSPASSGYHSQPWSPVSSEDSFVMSSTYAESGAAVWRPW